MRTTLFFLIAGCGGTDDAARLGETAAADLSEIIDELVTVTETGTCVDGAGDCLWCSTVEGAVNGTFEIAAESLPCGGERAWDSGSASYEVTAGGLSGTWDLQSPGLWHVSATGSRDATVAFDGRRVGTWDSSWSLDSFELDVLEGAPGDWSGALTYTSFARHVWTVTVEGTAGSFAGTVQRDDGVSCTIEGTVDGATVACDGGDA